MSEPTITVRFSVNGRPVEVTTHPLTRLLDVLREQLGLTGTKEGCGEGECGACSVLLLEGEAVAAEPQARTSVGGQGPDRRPLLVNSCLVPVLQVAGASVTTIEGIAADGRLHPVQEAFLTHGGAQCGICTPGMVLAALALLATNPRPSEPEIRTALAGNLCRCTGYVKIFAAVQAASAALGAADAR